MSCVNTAAGKHGMNNNVFLSYRRDDTQEVVGRIHDQFVKSLGEENVFFDIDSIPLGVDFRRVLGEEVGRCHVVIAVIGPNWLTAVDRQGRRRLDDPDDFVRIEVETALERGTHVVLALVKGARVPPADQLPASLAKMVESAAISVEVGPTFVASMNQLLSAVRAAPSGSARELTAVDRTALAVRRGRDWSIAGVMVAALLSLIISLLNLARTALDLPPVFAGVLLALLGLTNFAFGPVGAAFIGWRLSNVAGAVLGVFLAVCLGCASVASTSGLASLVFTDQAKVDLPVLGTPIHPQTITWIAGEFAIAGICLGGLIAAGRATSRWPRTWLKRQRELYARIIFGAGIGAILGAVLGTSVGIISTISPLKEAGGTSFAMLLAQFTIIGGIGGFLNRQPQPTQPKRY
jgi:hypothetical protein